MTEGQGNAKIHNLLSLLNENGNYQSKLATKFICLVLIFAFGASLMPSLLPEPRFYTKSPTGVVVPATEQDACRNQPPLYNDYYKTSDPSMNYKTSLVDFFGLYCADGYKRRVVELAIWLGAGLLTVALLALSDRLGRKTVLRVSGLQLFLGCAVIYFAESLIIVTLAAIVAFSGCYTFLFGTILYFNEFLGKLTSRQETQPQHRNGPHGFHDRPSPLHLAQ